MWESEEMKEGGQMTSCSHLRATRRSEDLKISHAPSHTHSHSRLQHTVTLDRSLTRTYARRAQLYRQLPREHCIVSSGTQTAVFHPFAHQ